MGNTIELTCGHCSKHIIIPDGEVGAIYTCPHCSGQNRAARQTKKKLTNNGWFWASVVLGIFVVGYYFVDLGGRPGVDSRQLNTIAFGLIADAHGEDFRTSAARTESALADIEDLVRGTSGADLDPRIREFAQMQTEYERAMAGAVATEREAYEHPERVPAELWRQALDYHQAARRLASKYLPNWVEGLDMRIEHDEKMIRRFE